jgi:hypothetical protein
MAPRTKFRNRFTIWVSILLPLFASTPLFAWECGVSLNAPKAIGVGETKTLYATGTPEGGSYSWSNLSSLTPSGDTATLIGYQPSYSDYIRVGVVYTSPSGLRCSESKYIWVYACDINLNGPKELKLGEFATLTVNKYSHTSGGSYIWSGPDTLVPDASGTYAIFTPEASGEAIFTVNYTEGSGADACSSQDSHVINVLSDCSITVHGDTEVPLDGTITLSGEATPAGGEFTWTNVSQVIPSVGNVYAYYTGDTPGTETVTVNYTTADGHTCDPVTHEVVTYTVDNLLGPYCANSGDTISKDKYTFSTYPSGFEQNIEITPEILQVQDTVFSATEDVMVTASVNPNSFDDDSSTTITVVNPDKTTDSSIALTIPNYVNDALNALGIGDATDLTLSHKYSRSQSCCNSTSIPKSTTGTSKLDLAIEAGPFTIVGIPLPKKFKEWITLDLLAVSASGDANISLQGDHNGCTMQTTWLGDGAISAGLNVGGEVKAKTPYGVVLQGKLNGDTNVTETLTTKSSSLVVEGNWAGLDVSGTIKLKIRKYFELSGGVKENVIKPRTIPQILIPLPNLS